MRTLVMRVKSSSVSVNNLIVGSSNYGLLLLTCFKENDSISDIDYMVKKVLNLRIFNDDNGVMNKSILDINGSILSISQFTLYANTKKGNRPSYMDALKGEDATKLFDLFNSKLSEAIHVETGIFGEDMLIENIMDGPVTILLESN